MFFSFLFFAFVLFCFSFFVLFSFVLFLFLTCFVSLATFTKTCKIHLSMLLTSEDNFSFSRNELSFHWLYKHFKKRDQFEGCSIISYASPAGVFPLFSPHPGLRLSNTLLETPSTELVFSIMIKYVKVVQANLKRTHTKRRVVA